MNKIKGVSVKSPRMPLVGNGLTPKRSERSERGSFMTGSEKSERKLPSAFAKELFITEITTRVNDGTVGISLRRRFG